MTYSEDKNEKIRTMRRQGKKYREIRERTGASFDKIADVCQDTQSSPSPSTTDTLFHFERRDNSLQKRLPEPAIEKNQRQSTQTTISQAQADQLVEKIVTALKKTQQPTANNTLDPHHHHLDPPVAQLEQAKQTQTTTPHLEKPDEKQKSNELQQQPIPMYYLLPANVTDLQQQSNTIPDQMIEPPQEPDDESPGIIDHLMKKAPDYIKALLYTIESAKKIHKAIQTWQQTGVYKNPLEKEDEKIRTKEI